MDTTVATPVHPGVLLKTILKQRGLTNRKAALLIGVHSSLIDGLVSQRLRLTPRIARLTAVWLGLGSEDATKILNAQYQYDYWLLDQDPTLNLR
ncbi:helix-turn-helix transcriptional regulator [Paraburkholderia saeva]|uniref:helix-turn-helix transcriptional regulator n=1 Tax=Paraburkholderia saeva TaxID=2777537 RepID=UPI001DEAC1B2|nr:hypothetical protein [Paraburkholderia saeva]CAG4916185.1 hypothetical protein R70241_04423 [Paraburkholderia saeva]